MAFAYTRLWQNNVGGVRKVGGNFTNVSSGTGGSISTGLKVVNGIQLTSNSTTNPYYSTTLPSTASDGAITIVTGSTDSGTWEVTGV